MHVSGPVLNSFAKIIVSFGALRAFCRSLMVLTTNDRAEVSGRNTFGRSFAFERAVGKL